MKRRFLGLTVAFTGAAVLSATALAGKRSSPHYPDMQTVVPTQLQLVNEHQREVLRFSNGVANRGSGPWALRPEFRGTVVAAIQEIRDGFGNVILEEETGHYEFHPEHNHWHIGDIALFEVREGTPYGAIVGDNAEKVTFCLIDWYKLDDNSNTAERTFWDCATSYQGISAGWVDQYHQSLEGQELDLTGIPDGDNYYLVSTANPDGIFLESNYGNNTAWVRFRLYHGANGNRKLEVTDHSPCDTPNMCGEGIPNR